MSRRTWRQHAAERGRDYIITGVISIVVVFTLTGLWSFGRDLYLEQQNQTDWFQYHGIEYEGLDSEARGGLGSLRMVSDMEVHRPLTLRFHDVLRCRNIGASGARDFVSQNPDTQAFVSAPYERRSVRWLYNGDYVTGRDCIVRSTITAEIDGVIKTQPIDSPSFVVETDG